MRTQPGSRDRRGMQSDTASAPDGRTGPPRILLVDDHEISRAALRALLRTEGLDVADVRTGDAAITAAIAFRPDVAIVDVTPADPGGFHIARQLRALPGAPLVVFTSSASRCRFGPQLEHHPFVAKADLCARTIETPTTACDDRAR
jgi:CheY-like chemotaxis protein